MPTGRRYNLFARLSAEIATLKPELTGAVLCPLCLAAFDGEALASGALTEEHIIPSSLGGRVVTLTCKSCNNVQGSKIDAHLVNMVRSHASLRGDGKPLRGTMEFMDHSLPVRVGMASDGGTSVIRVLGGSPESIKQLLVDFGTLGAGASLELNLKMDYAEQPFQRAILRVAYLTLFSDLGYRYALSRGGNVIRKIVIGETAITAVPKLVYPLMNVQGITKWPRPVIGFTIRAEGGIVAHLVVICLRSQEGFYYSTVLPAAEVPEDCAFEMLGQIHGHLSGVRLNLDFG